MGEQVFFVCFVGATHFYTAHSWRETPLHVKRVCSSTRETETDHPEGRFARRRRTAGRGPPGATAPGDHRRKGRVRVPQMGSAGGGQEAVGGKAGEETDYKHLKKGRRTPETCENIPEENQKHLKGVKRIMSTSSSF